MATKKQKEAADGYDSWSPSEAFEQGYSPLDEEAEQ